MIPSDPMIPGSYSVCRIVEEDSDAAIYTTVKHGFDKREQAFEAIPEIALEQDIPADELVVIRFIYAGNTPPCRLNLKARLNSRLFSSQKLEINLLFSVRSYVEEDELLCPWAEARAVFRHFR